MPCPVGSSPGRPLEGPTNFAPGSPAKIDVLADRAGRGLPLFVPGDASMHTSESHPRAGHDTDRRPLPKGVSRYRYRGQIRYRARIRLGGSARKVSLGIHDTVEEAVAAIVAVRNRA